MVLALEIIEILFLLVWGSAKRIFDEWSQTGNFAPKKNSQTWIDEGDWLRPYQVEDFGEIVKDNLGICLC